MLTLKIKIFLREVMLDKVHFEVDQLNVINAIRLGIFQEIV